MDREVNYKNKRRYKTAKYPIRQPIYLTWLIQFLSKIMLMGKDYKLEKINMEGVKPPYILLSNHMSFIDFELVSGLTYPQKVNNVVNIDGYHMMPWLLTWIGSICTRKFTNDIHLVKSIRRVVQNGDILCRRCSRISIFSLHQERHSCQGRLPVPQRRDHQLHEGAQV